MEALAAALASGLDLPQASQDAQAFTWNTLANGYRPGMGQVIPDRLFWAHEPEDEDDASDT